MKRYFQPVALCVAIAAMVGANISGAADNEAAADGDSLTIGSQAPPLDIEHWLPEGDGEFEPVSEFEQGNVYVVEFWATWCGPCINSMPHLAEMQKEYADRGVRIVSVSDEDLETVEKFLKRPTPQDEDVTFGELTSAYSLTTDPDQSTFNDYMRAAGQTGIPAAFIVGKTGEIEWIGHPMQMDEPLEKVVTDDWDRDAFAEKFQQEKANEEAMAKAMQLARNGETADAVSLLEERIEATSDPQSLASLKQYKLRILMSDPEMGEQVAEVVQEMLDDPSEDTFLAYQIGSVVNQLARTGNKNEKMIESAIEKLRTALSGAEEPNKPFLYHTMAQLLQVQGNLDEAIAAEQEAVKRAEGPVAERLKSYLDELQKEAQQDTEPSAEN